MRLLDCCTQTANIMSRSIHITKRNFKDLSKKEIDDQVVDPHSDLNQWVRKSVIKKDIRENRRDKGLNKQ
jgi:hypothetical protein